jgi:hemerythrin
MSRYQSPVIELDEIPIISHDSMHETHLEEVNLINELGYKIEQYVDGNVDNDVISDKLTEWIDHTRQHFDEENRLMEEFDFSAYPMHKLEHQKVLSHIEKLQKIWVDDAQIEPMADYIFLEWPTWFDNHVNTMDLVTAEFLNQIMSEENESA